MTYEHVNLLTSQINQFENTNLSSWNITIIILIGVWLINHGLSRPKADPHKEVRSSLGQVPAFVSSFQLRQHVHPNSYYKEIATSTSEDKEPAPKRHFPPPNQKDIYMYRYNMLHYVKLFPSLNKELTSRTVQPYDRL